MNKRLKSEIWEIQVILYLILAQLIATPWIKYLIWFWCVVTFLGVLRLQIEAKREEDGQKTKK